MKVLISKLVWPAYFAALIYLSYTGVNQYRDATSILNDHTVVEAPIELVDTSSKTKRGHTTKTYIFNYAYNVDGKNYSAEYSAVNEMGERYLAEPFITIAYSNTDPTNVGALWVLEEKSGVGGYVKGFLIIALVLGVIAILVYGWSLPDEEDEEEENLSEANKN
jgi:hypothetical protein